MTEPAPPNTAVISRAAIYLGIRQTTPVAMFVIPYGIAFGVAAGAVGLSFEPAMVMSATVFAGASQFAALEIWSERIPLIPLILLTAAVNSRLVLIGAAAHLWMRELPWRMRLFVASLLSDTGLATASQIDKTIGRNAGVLVGGGLALWIAWMIGSCIGLSLGAEIGDPKRYGLDVVILALFSAVLVSSWNGVRTGAPWLVAAIVAILTSAMLEGGWHIILGGFAGGVTGVLIRTEAKNGA